MKKHPPSHWLAFSLVEVLAAVAIIGIITFLAIPNIVKLKEDGEESLARSRAETLNLAMASFVQANGPAASQTAWSGKSDNARYALLAPYIAFAEPTLADYMPGGYSVSLPNAIYPLTQKTGLTGPQGNIGY